MAGSNLSDIPEEAGWEDADSTLESDDDSDDDDCELSDDEEPKEETDEDGTGVIKSDAEDWNGVGDSSPISRKTPRPTVTTNNSNATATITMDVNGEAADLRLRLPAVFFTDILINHLRKIASDCNPVDYTTEFIKFIYHRTPKCKSFYVTGCSLV